jgi:ATP-binding cassette subfamily F protein 3
MSGGERARVSLLKLMLKGGNFLLLDEPTNHLDAASREELEKTLLDYNGTLLIISHDRYFINKLADRILVLTKDGFKEYLGNYDYYIERTKAQQTEEKAQTIQNKKEKSPNDYQLQKQRQSEERKRKTRLAKTEKLIEDLEQQIEETNDLLQSEEVIADYEKLMELTAKLEELHSQLDEAYILWDELSE